MHYEIKFLCNDDIYTITLSIPQELHSKMDAERRDSYISSVIDIEKEDRNIADYSHVFIGLKKSADGVNWEEMI